MDDRDILGARMPLRAVLCSSPPRILMSVDFPPLNFTGTSENRGWTPNCMEMLEATITGIPETKQPASASFL